MNNKNNNNINNIKPLIFTNKVNDKYKIIPLNFTNNTIGLTRYFPPATKEWFNSVYAYNKNSIKNFSIADKTFSKLIKSYFNLFFSKKVLKSKRIATRFRRLSLKKIFISKAELKHTSTKVIITLYIYNEEKRLLARRLRRLEVLIFPSKYWSSRKVKKDTSLSLKDKLFLLRKHKERVPLLVYLEEIKSSIFELKLDLEHVKLNAKNLLFIEKLDTYADILSDMIILCKNDKNTYEKLNTFYNESLRKTYIEREIRAIAYYKLLLNLNRSKFEDKFLMRLKPLTSKIYNKSIEFNIINLKTLYLNSDIFTEAISIKLKNRDNKLLRVLKTSLRMVKLPKVNKVREKYDLSELNEIWAEKVKNLQANSIVNEYKSNEDTLNQLLLNILPNYFSGFFKEDVKEEISFNNSLQNINENKANVNSTVQDLVLNSLKHKSMAGARLEAKGRLTRRFTASRSVFKIKWKGSLKNIDSSYKKLSTVILRGHVKSNVQYSIINSKTRNGAFGLKGWISSK